ncbi:unnamed protein product, partial [marine sediment metagenome]
MAVDNEKPSGFLGGLWDTVSSFFEAGFTKVWSGFSDNMLKSFISMKLGITQDWMIAGEQNWDKMLSVFEKNKWIDAETKMQLKKLQELPYAGGMISYFAVFLLLTLKQVTTWSDVIGSDIRRNLNIQHRPVDAAAGELIHAAFLDPKEKTKVKQILTQLGLPDEQIDLLFLSFHRAYDEGTIRTLYFREVITETQVF